ncbi:hypothetical protein FA95DRAFT_650231 [Auriscalpium vulgare]|uniref:Uncharacterized protein n=1 Tax=Auriscalpium vulgare TaxID=40419 RepID=A0ACB8RCJ6_9AGAM|nr:hypothetical protein FA95DRAFT_650231 [Auriscalpium vulgare]
MRKTWRVEAEWVCGGEEILRDDGGDIEEYEAWCASLQRPWWEHQEQPSAPGLPDAPPPLQGDPIAPVPSLLLPLPLLAPFTFFSSSDAFPTGYVCPRCGRVSFQAHLRHRACPSSHCRPAPALQSPRPAESEGWAVEAECVRDARGVAPCTFVDDACAHGTAALPVSVHDDDMRVFGYCLAGPIQAANSVLLAANVGEEVGQPKNEDGEPPPMSLLGSLEAWHLFAWHLFTCNDYGLQEDASALFEGIQRHVRLKRQLAGACFSSEIAVSTDAPPEGDGLALCAGQIKNFVESRLSAYLEELGSLRVQKIIARAYVNAGKCREPYRAQIEGGACLAVVCLGADAIYSSIDTNTQRDPSSRSGKLASALSVTLIHGDMLVLRGGLFQFSVTRTGMCILLEVLCSPTDNDSAGS